MNGEAGSVRDKKGSGRGVGGGEVLPYDVDDDDEDSVRALDQRSVSLHRGGPGGKGPSPFLGVCFSLHMFFSLCICVSV